MREADVDAAGLAVVPHARPAIDAGCPRLLAIAQAELVARAQVVGRAIAVQRYHRIAEVSERERTLVLDAPHRLPGVRQELVRDLALVDVRIGLGRDELSFGAA